MAAKRAQIRRYLVSLLREHVDVGGNVFTSRQTDPLRAEVLPAVVVTIEGEDVSVASGSAFLPREYRRDLSVVITVVAQDDGTGEDVVDDLAEQVEHVLQWDRFLARRLPGFDPNKNFHGLVFGSLLQGVSAYSVQTDTDTRVLALDLRYVFPYGDEAHGNLRLQNFEEYRADIVNRDGVVLVSMEGKL